MNSEPAGLRGYVVDRRGDLLTCAWWLTGDRAAAESLVQDTLSRVWPRWKRQARRGDPHAYVRQVLVRRCTRGRRRRWRPVRGLDSFPVVEASPAGGLPGVGVSGGNAAALLADLTPGQRAIVVLRHVERCPDAQIAATLRCSADTVRRQYAEALTCLRRPRVDVTARDRA